jgi:uncharacterized MAPEG superfamily protein
MWMSTLSAYQAPFHMGCMIAFTVARCGHTVAFAYGIQPYRSLLWFVAVLAVFLMLGNGLHGIFAMIPLGMGTTVEK